MIEESGSRSIPLTNKSGSVSGRSKRQKHVDPDQELWPEVSTSKIMQFMLFLKETVDFVDAVIPLIITIFGKFHLIFISSIKIFFLMLFEFPYFLFFG
jgi:hypothetical protein